MIASFVGLTTGDGGIGACRTSSRAFGGWSYEDAAGASVAGAADGPGVAVDGPVLAGAGAGAGDAGDAGGTDAAHDVSARSARRGQQGRGWDMSFALIRASLVRQRLFPGSSPGRQIDRHPRIHPIAPYPVGRVRPEPQASAVVAHFDAAARRDEDLRGEVHVRAACRREP